MKLKYYLRGVGIGIVFATLVMTVSGLEHKYNISEEYIIKEARKLGMVMKDELDGNNGLFGNGGSQEIEESQATEESTATEENGSANSEIPEDSQDISSEVQPSESESESQVPVESETPVESESQVESETPVYVTIVVEGGDSARQVADKAKEVGLIEDAEVLRDYLRDHGYSHDILVGSFQIPLGADLEEICRILTTRE